MSEHTTPASIAAALRRAADDIEALGDITLDPTNVQISLQAVTYDGTPDGRAYTVDQLGIALTGEVGEKAEEEDDTSYRLPFDARYRRGDLNAAVFTDLTDAEFHRSNRGGAR